MLDLRTPKGTIDLNPSQAYTQNEIIEKVKKFTRSVMISLLH